MVIVFLLYWVISLDTVSFDGAAHTTSATTATTQFITWNRQNFDTCLVVLLVGVNITFVTDNRARFHCQYVVGVIPLLSRSAS